MATVCPACATACPPTARFCAECGSPLRAAATQSAEHRQLTVMFCDLVGSTRLSTILEVEDYRDLIAAYHGAACDVIETHGGYVAQYLGDGILVYFGHPLAHEDDVPRAARAALGILAAMERLNTARPRADGIRLEVRIGVHTGPTIVGTVGSEARHERLALGEAPNVAARVQGLAQPGEVLLSGVTAALLGEAFALGELESHEVKGRADPVVVQRLFGERRVDERLTVDTGPLRPLVGREVEAQALKAAWAAALDGRGQVVVISGEAGIGKSRLVAHCRTIAAGGAHARLEAYAADHLRNTALHPFVDLVQRTLRLNRNDPPEKTLETLERGAAAYPVDVAEVVPLLAAMLSVPVPDGRYPVQNLTAASRKRKTIAAVTTIIGEIANLRPSLFVLEDLHWVDPSSLEMLDALMDVAATRRLLIVVTHRPEFVLPWRPRDHLTTIALGRLGEREVRRLVESVLGPRGQLSPALVAQILARTDGVPLYVEALTRNVMDHDLAENTDKNVDAPALPAAVDVPTSLQASLTARLDRLGSARPVAQLAAAIGRRLPLRLLQAISGRDPDELTQALNALVRAEILRPDAGGTEPYYVFRHALVRDAAYGTLLRSTRTETHRRVAEAMSRDTELERTQPELLAEHLSASDQPARALGYWLRAGQRALERWATQEARHHFKRGLDCLPAVPAGTPHDLAELGGRMGVAVSLQAARGFGAPELGPLYERALELSEGLGDGPQLVPVLRGMFLFYGIRDEAEVAGRVANRLLTLAEGANDPSLLLEALRTKAFHEWTRGSLAASMARLEQGIALYDPDMHRAHVARFGGIDPGLACWIWKGLLLAWTGRPEEAELAIERSLSLADTIGHPLGVCTALQWAGVHWLDRGDVGRVRGLASRSLEVATEHGVALNVALARVQLGWVAACEGRVDEGLAEMAAGTQLYQSTGALFCVPLLLSQAADAGLRAGATAAGLAAAEAGLAWAEKYVEPCWEAELHRRRGELLLAQTPPDPAGAHAAFTTAHARATAHGAHALAARAAERLAGVPR